VVARALWAPQLRGPEVAWQQGDGAGHAVSRARGMVQGMLRVEHVEQFCDTCILTKQRWLPFPRQASFRAKEKLELVHGDLCGPMTLATPRGRRFFLLLVDDVSG